MAQSNSKKSARDNENIPIQQDDVDVPLVMKTGNNLENNIELNVGQKKRLDYLLKQAEIFTHFVKNGAKAKQNGQLGKDKTLVKAVDESVKKRTKAKKEESSIDQVKVHQYDKTPDFIVGEMHDYQICGLNWLISLCENGIGGILGDEMGLGKTLQTISILGYLKNVKKVKGKFLVVAPLSTLQNWLNEANRFCPSINAFILHGTKDVRGALLNRLKTNDPQWDLCIASYETCRKVVGPLTRIKWTIIVLDEGHKMKNEKSQIHKALQTIESNSRLILTGTPLNNSLHELWALLSYLVPDVFSNAHDFDSWFDSDDCLRGNNEVVNRLHAVLEPFMLRRIKADVLKSLLPKIEMKLYIGMTALQRETYINVLMKKVETIDSFGEVSVTVLRGLVMQLRKVGNHPYLIDGIEPGPPFTTDQHLVDSCGKMIVLDQLLTKLKSQGSRVVLFSQFVIVLNIIEDYLTWKGYNFRRLDGSLNVATRNNDIDSFNAENSDVFIFIISTRAGGLGINLATADTVIIYDSDWNPQSDFQAIDRVHRIGQKKQVHIYRLITEKTVDHRVVQRAEIKKRLDKLVIKHGQSSTAQTRGEMIEAIKCDMDNIMEKDKIKNESHFDLEEILKESAIKATAEQKILDRMTLEEASSSSVYQFDGVDFRSTEAGTSQS